MNTDNYAEQMILINEYLDEMSIPRRTTAGGWYSTYGRVCLLGDKMKELENKVIILWKNEFADDK